MSQNPQSDEIQVSRVMHKRCCSRALSNVLALRKNAVPAAKIQRYLSLWAGWWKSVGNWKKKDLLLQWAKFTRANMPDAAWYGSGLIAFEEKWQRPVKALRF